MKYTDLLAKHNIEAKQLSPALKRLVGDYTAVEKEIADARAKLDSGKVAENKKQKLQEDIDEGEETLTQLNDELIPAIQKWLNNREANLEKGRKLAASRAAKKNPSAAASTTAASGASGESTPAATEGTQTPAASTTTATHDENGNVGTATPQKKKDNSGWIIGGIFMGLLLAIGGVAYYKSQRQTI